MPRLWVLNIDDVVPRADVHYRSVFLPKAGRLPLRFLFCIRPGDAMVCQSEIPAGFLRYVRGVNDLPPPESWLLRTRKEDRPYSVVGSVMADPGLLSKLKEMGRSGGWRLEPFIESPTVGVLSRAAGIPMGGSRTSRILDGTILKLNDKGYFKSLARLLDIETTPGYLAGDLESLRACIEQVSRENGDRIILRKARHAGGMGNLSGKREELLRRIPTWYNGGDVLVERWLDLEQTAGSLVVIGEDASRFAGVDIQLFAHGHWSGFAFPHPDRRLTKDIREKSLRIAEVLYRKNVRGELNVDWGIVKGPGGRLRPVALESNFRHNGFGYLLRFADDYFGRKARSLRIRYMEDFRLRPGLRGFEPLARVLAGVRVGREAAFVDRPGLSRGAVLMMPPNGECCALALFGDTPAYLTRLEAALRKDLC